MVVLEVHRKCVQKIYKSYLISKATLFIVILNLVVIIVPFILAYYSNGFWLKHDVFYEQPTVHFRGEYLFVAVTTNLSRPIICGNLFPEEFDSCHGVKVEESDENLDGKIDQFNFILDVDYEDRVKSCTLLLPIDYRLRTCPTNTQSLIVHQQQIDSSATKVKTLAQLTFGQKTPLMCTSEVPANEYNSSVLSDHLNFKDNIRLDLDGILTSYLQRNVTMHLQNLYTVPYLGIADRRRLEISLSVSYPMQRFYYKATFWQNMKHAWIQYYAVYVIILVLVTQVREYVFDNRFVLFYEHCPWKKTD